MKITHVSRSSSLATSALLLALTSACSGSSFGGESPEAWGENTGALVPGHTLARGASNSFVAVKSGINGYYMAPSFVIYAGGQLTKNAQGQITNTVVCKEGGYGPGTTCSSLGWAVSSTGDGVTANYTTLKVTAPASAALGDYTAWVGNGAYNSASFSVVSQGFSLWPNATLPVSSLGGPGAYKVTSLRIPQDGLNPLDLRVTPIGGSVGTINVSFGLVRVPALPNPAPYDSFLVPVSVLENYIPNGTTVTTTGGVTSSSFGLALGGLPASQIPSSSPPSVNATQNVYALNITATDSVSGYVAMDQSVQIIVTNAGNPHLFSAATNNVQICLSGAGTCTSYIPSAFYANGGRFGLQIQSPYNQAVLGCDTATSDCQGITVENGWSGGPNFAPSQNCSGAPYSCSYIPNTYVGIPALSYFQPAIPGSATTAAYEDFVAYDGGTPSAQLPASPAALHFSVVH